MRAVVRTLRYHRDAFLITRGQAFDADWYSARYPDVVAAGVEPLRHYLEWGWCDNRYPNPVFDRNWYASTYLTPDCKQDPLVHFLRRGAARGHKPNRRFDPVNYAKKLGLPVRTAVSHYLERGVAQRRQGSVPCASSGDSQCLDDGRPSSSVLRADARVRAYLGDVTSYYVTGWASRNAGPPLGFSVVVNGMCQGRVEPWIARPDVTAALGITALGFYFEFPKRLNHGDKVELWDDFGFTLECCERIYSIPPLGASDDLYASRAAIAAAFLKGRGVEIGAFTQPTDLPPDRNVSFLDRYPVDRLRNEFYEAGCGRPLMEPTYIGDAGRLDCLPEASFNFLIANHVIEHLLDPIEFLKRVSSKLLVGGRAMIAAPDQRFSFDRGRALTSFQHLVDDHTFGGERSRSGHVVEWAVAEGYSAEEASRYAGDVSADEISFHYHVWTAESFFAFVQASIDHYGLPLIIVHTASTEHEATIVLEKIACV